MIANRTWQQCFLRFSGVPRKFVLAKFNGEKCFVTVDRRPARHNENERNSFGVWWNGVKFEYLIMWNRVLLNSVVTVTSMWVEVETYMLVSRHFRKFIRSTIRTRNGIELEDFCVDSNSHVVIFSYCSLEKHHVLVGPG